MQCHLWGNLQHSSSIFNTRKDLKLVTLSSTLEKLEKEDQMKLKVNRRKETIKIRVEINNIETKKKYTERGAKMAAEVNG